MKISCLRNSVACLYVDVSPWLTNASLIVIFGACEILGDGVFDESAHRMDCRRVVSG